MTNASYKKFADAWEKWMVSHPDGEIKDEQDGCPKTGKLFNSLDNPAIKRLMLKMLNPNPELRITMAEVINTSYFKKIECCTLESFEDSTKCSINAATKDLYKFTVRPKHYHVPPKVESKVKLAMQHRFDMGDGYR